VAWGSVAPLPLWSQNREHVVLMLRIQCQGGGYWAMLDEKEMDKIIEEGRSVCHPSGGDFRSPRTSFGKKNTWNFFWVCMIARVLFYQCSPYLKHLFQISSPHGKLRPHILPLIFPHMVPQQCSRGTKKRLSQKKSITIM
jgi:hypothetical protein